MVAVNQEYNYNFPNLNFGQMLLYGVLGGLTGGNGMGGYLGGYNSGWGASIFPMATMMTGYNCFPGMGCYSDSMVGAQIGSTISQCAFNAITQIADGLGSRKAERKEAISTANNNIEVLTSEISELQTENDTLSKITIKEDGKVDSIVKEACSEKATAYTTAYNALKPFISDPPTDPDSKIIAEKQKYLDEHKDATDRSTVEAEKKAHEKLFAEAKAKAETALKTATNELNQAIQDKIEKNKKEITKKKADLEKAKQNLKKEVNDDINSKYNADDYEKVVGKWENGKFNKDGFDSKENFNLKKYRKAFDYAFSHFCSARSQNERNEYKAQANAIYDVIKNNAQTGDLKQFEQKLDILDNNAKKDFGLN